MRQLKLLRVMANPFCCDLDHEGRTHGQIVYEPDLRNGDAQLRHVGCKVQATQIRSGDPREQIQDDWDHVWVYSTEPVVVADTAYYRTQLQHHTLLAADEATQKAAFGTAAGFVDPLKRLAQYVVERGAYPEPVEAWTALLAPHIEAHGVAKAKAEEDHRAACAAERRTMAAHEQPEEGV